MKKKEIIKRSEDYTKIINNSPYKKNNYYIIYYKSNKEQNRFGITIPKKTGKAHLRNKIKRRIKNIIDLNKKIMHNYNDYVIIVRKRIIELNYQQMEKFLLELLKKIGEENETK